MGGGEGDAKVIKNYLHICFVLIKEKSIVSSDSKVVGCQLMGNMDNYIIICYKIKRSCHE